MMNELINVTRSSMPSIQEYMAEIAPLWDTYWLTNMGEKHEQLESELKKYLGVENISLMSNGHMALELTLQAFELEGEVITTPYTFASTTHAIVRNGLTPVFCDIKEDCTIDPEKIEACITEKTSAIVPVHVYGCPCDVDAIEKIAKKHNLKVIYDAAHTFGVKKDGVGLGNFGDAAIYSFHATKVFHTIEGGAVVYKDEAIGERLYNLKNFGIHGPENVEFVGANAKMNEFQAAMGICNLRHIEDSFKDRGRVKELYYKRLDNVLGLRLLKDKKGVKTNNAYLPIFIDEVQFGKSRDEVYEALREKGIRSRKYFYPLTSAFECYQGKFEPEKTPIALKTSREVLVLPMYEGLANEDVERICNIILG